jgi:hypothetical protein
VGEGELGIGEYGFKFEFFSIRFSNFFFEFGQGRKNRIIALSPLPFPSLLKKTKKYLIKSQFGRHVVRAQGEAECAHDAVGEVVVREVA